MSNQTMDEKLDDILKIVIDIKDNAVHKDDFNKLTKRVETIENKVGGLENKIGGLENKIDVIDHRLGNVESTLVRVEERLTKVETNLEGVKAGVEKTADILEQKQIINVAERQQIYHAADPFALPA